MTKIISAGCPEKIYHATASISMQNLCTSRNWNMYLDEKFGKTAYVLKREGIPSVLLACGTGYWLPYQSKGPQVVSYVTGGGSIVGTGSHSWNGGTKMSLGIRVIVDLNKGIKATGSKGAGENNENPWNLSL